MVVEQAASASWMVQACIILTSLTAAMQVAFASLTVAKHKAWASRVAWEQMALVSLMDSVTWDSFWWSSIPSSQMALYLQVSMDALVVSSSSRALLAFSQSSIASAGGLMLPDLQVMAMGEMLVGIPSRDASAISVLAWDEVSTGWSSSFGLWGGGVRMTTGFGLLGVEFSDLQPDVSSTTRDRRFLTSMVMLPSLSDLGGGLMGAGYHGGGDLANRQYLSVWLLCQGWQDVNFQVDGLACGKAYAVGQWLW